MPQSFDTPLTPQEESQFQTWKAQYAPQDSGADYDLRGAFKAGVKPDPITRHWPDTFKKPNHPTFSVESQYAQFAPNKAGQWTGPKHDIYVPAGGTSGIESILHPLKMPDNIKADAWDAFYDSKDENDLAQRLQKIAIPQETKAQLWDMKMAGKSAAPATAPRKLGPVTPPATYMDYQSPFARFFYPAAELARNAGQGAMQAATQTPGQQIMNAVGGIAGSHVEQLQKAFQPGQSAQNPNAPGLVERGGHLLAAALPVVGPMAANLAEGPAQSGDVAGVLGGAATMLAPELRKVPGVQAARNFAMDYVPNRLMSSLIKPDKASFDFGASPVKAVLDINAIAPSLERLTSQIQNGMKAAEARLQATVSSFRGVTQDVAPVIMQAMDDVIKQAKRDANPSLAQRLETIRDIRLNEIQQKYGTTTLNPEQILEVKRTLKGEVKFNPKDTVEETLNDAKMNMYRNIDKTLDTLTNGATKPINQQYAGLIEADLSLRKRIAERNRSDILPGTIMAAAKKLPSTFAKTFSSQAARRR